MQTIGCEATVGARDKRSVVTGILGNANIQVGCRTACRAGYTEDQSLIIVRLLYCTSVDDDLSNIHNGIAQVQLGSIVGFRERRGYDRASANRACCQAGCPDGGIAVNGGGNGHRIGSHALLGHRGLVPGGIEGQSHKSVACNGAASNRCTDAFGRGVGIGSNADTLRG